jgi:hypothetical protein
LTSLVSLLSLVMAEIQASPLCRKAAIAETKEFSADQFFFKIRAEITRTISLQVRMYYNRGYLDYSYQLFSDVPLLRWDNKEDFPGLINFPHHHHDDQGRVHSSTLVGDPSEDIRKVLGEIERFLNPPVATRK